MAGDDDQGYGDPDEGKRRESVLQEEGPGGRGAFDPTPYFRQLRGRGGAQDYLDVKFRLLWLRREHPDAEILTEHIRIDEGVAIFKATVSIPGGGKATGHGSETAGDFPDYIEKAECVPLRSEILTRDGFKSFNEVVVGEEVLAYDIEADKTVWTPLLQVSAFPRGRVISMSNRADWRVECTNDHSWAISRNTFRQMTWSKVRELRQAQRLKTQDAIILAAPAPSGTHPLTPPEAAFLGWLFTDGHLKASGRGMIAQTKEPQVSRIRELLGATAREYSIAPSTRVFPTGRAYLTREKYQWHIPATVLRPLLEKANVAAAEDLPKLVSRLSAESRKSMLDAFMAAEGDSRGNFAQKHGPVLEAFQILATLEGIALAPPHASSFGNITVQRLKKRRHVCASELTIEEIGELPVWCPTTGYGTWVMRQDGIVTITGNTKALGRALNALGYGAQFAEPDAEEEAQVPPQAPPARQATPATPRAAATQAPAPARPATVEEQPQSVAPTPTPMTGRGATERRTAATPSRPTPVEIGAARERPAPPSPTPFPSTTPPRQTATTTTADQEPPLEDYSWTAFWKWAREQGYESKGGIEAFIGRPMNNLNPAEVRQLILAKRAET